MAASRTTARLIRRRPAGGLRVLGLAATCTALVLLTGAALGPAPAHAAEPTDWSVIGHRGLPRSGHTEDTLPSLRAAVRAGATSVELDLRLTADSGMLVMHDATLDRTTTCQGKVADRTLRDILDSCRGKAAGEPIPTAGRMLAWAQAHRVNAVLELKYDPTTRWTDEQIVALDDLIKARGMTDRVVLMSLRAAYLAKVEMVDPALETDWIADGWPGVETIVARGDVVNVDARELTVGRVEELHAAGVRVFGRDTDSTADWRRLDRVGADGLLTDRTAAYVAWRAHHDVRRR